MIIHPTLPPMADYVEIENENGEHIYKYIGEPSPTVEERLEAQVLYTALITDTLIESEEE